MIADVSIHFTVPAEAKFENLCSGRFDAFLGPFNLACGVPIALKIIPLAKASNHSSILFLCRSFQGFYVNSKWFLPMMIS